MILSRLVFAIMLLLGFATSVFAGGGDGGGGGDIIYPPDPNFPKDEFTRNCGAKDVKCTGAVYRCFKYLGKSQNDSAKNTNGYCLPKPAVYCKDGGNDYSWKYSQKEWKWSYNLGFKKDKDGKPLQSSDPSKVEETERSKKFCHYTSCEATARRNNFGSIDWGAISDGHPFVYGVLGSSTPVDTYTFCAREYDNFDKNQKSSNFTTIAKCVDKNNDKVVDNSFCDTDKKGDKYYYKPNCSNEADCNKKFVEWSKSDVSDYENSIIRFCYVPFTQDSSADIEAFYDNQGGQTVRFKEFAYTSSSWLGFRYSVEGPCSRPPYYAINSSTAPEEQKAANNIIIQDKDDNEVRDESFVHTKISGFNSYMFKITPKSNKEDADAIITECEVTDKDDKVASAKESPKKVNSKAKSGILARVASLFSGRAANSNEWQWEYKPLDSKVNAKSGTYTITCKGKSKAELDKPDISANTTFFVAPNSYEFKNISAVFKDKDGKIKSINLLKGITQVPYSKDIVIESKIEAPKVNNAINWKDKIDKRPVIKIGDTISISLAEINAKNAANGVDVGVNKDNKIGAMKAVLKVTTLGITSSNNSVTASSKPNCKPTDENGNETNLPSNIGNIQLVDGKAQIDWTKIDAIDKANIASKIEGKEAQVARAKIVIYDESLNTKIEEEQGLDKCGDKSFPCPYPKPLELEMDYEIIPANFKAELTNQKDEPIKVLYFGMGTSPKVEAGYKVKVTALKTLKDGLPINNPNYDIKDTDIAKKFTNGCAAQDMQFVSSGNKDNKTKQAYIEITNRDNTGFSIKANNFTSGVAGSNDAIIKVQKDKDITFTPAMKSEPVIIDSLFILSATMQYEHFPDYPKYENVVIKQGKGNIAILRGRINAIDTDNGTGNNIGTISPTKVWYEFQCEYCNLDKITAITGKTYTRSPTQQGWWIDSAFGENNGNYITANKIGIESGGLPINAVNPNNGVATGAKDAGLQSISYGSATQGTYKLNIRHGNESTNGTFSGATTMPYFLLYNAFWTGTQEIINGVKTSTLQSPIKWNTSSFIYVKGKAADDKRNYGVDTGGAKNTRSGGRTGKY